MPDKAVRNLFIALSVIGALSLNNWLLGISLNHELYSQNGSISEFSAAGQPHAWAFRLLDIIAGLTLLGIAFLLSRLPKKTFADKILMLSIAGLGVSSILDALFVLSCSDTLDSACHIPISLSISNYQMPAHAYSSVAEAIFYFALPLGGFLYARAYKHKILFWSSGLLVIVAVWSFISALAQYVSEGGVSVKASGSGQEAQVLLLGIWVVVLGFCLARNLMKGSLESKAV